MVVRPSSGKFPDRFSQVELYLSADVQQSILKRFCSLSSRQRAIVHVGMLKTGSSYLQSSLALSANRLLGHNVLYPHHSSFPRAKAGKVTNGNGAFLSELRLSKEKELLVGYLKEARRRSSNLVLSNESLANRFALDPHLFRLLKAYVSDSDFELVFILFVRDPFDQSVSRWNQAVKTGREKRALQDYLLQCEESARLLKFLALVTEHGITLRTSNFSRENISLLGTFESLLDVIPGTLSAPAHRVNTSLNPKFANLQRSINTIPGLGGRLRLANIVGSNTTSVRIRAHRVSAKTIEAFAAKQEAIVESINSLLPSDSELRLPGQP